MNQSEQKRLEVLQNYHIIESDLREELEGLTKIASNICDTPISLINLLDANHQVTKASQGWDLQKIARDSSFCQFTLSDSEMMIVEDAQQDRRFRDSPFVQSDPHIRFYAGMPLRTRDGHNLGAICVIDNEPRQLTPSQKENLRLLADEVVARFELVRSKHELQQRNDELEKSEIFLRNSSDIQAILDPDTHKILEINDEGPKLLGGSKSSFLNQHFGDYIADPKARERMLAFLDQRSKKEGQFIAPITTSGGKLLYMEYAFSWHKNQWFMTARDITKREKAQQELKKRSQAIEASMDGVAILDPDFNFTYINQSHAQIFGYTKEELEGRRWEILYDMEERNRFKTYVARILQNNKQWRGEAEGLKKNGQTFPLELSLSVQPNDNIVCIARDITKRRRTQEKLRRTLTNLTIGQDLAKVGSWTWNINNDEVRWSEKVYDICGIDDVSTQPSMHLFGDLVHPDDREDLSHLLQKINNGEGVESFEHRLKTPDGKVKWVRHSGRINFDEAGKPVEIVGAILDITQEKQAQLELQREKELSDKIINSLPISFFMFDHHGNAIRWNDTVRKITGYSEQQIAYMEPADFFPEQARAEVQQHIEQVFSDGEATIEISMIDAEGNTIPHIYNAKRFEGQSKNYFIGTGVDISELKEYEQQLEQSLEEKKVLLSEIHHRVKNNLAIISGLLQLESFNTDDSQTQNILQNSQMRIHSMAQVHEMLYEANDFSNLPFEDFVAKIVDSIQGVYRKPAADLHFDLDIQNIQLNVNQAIPCSLIINETVTNAYKHAFEEGQSGHIAISLTESNGTITLCVKDNGKGLPDDFSLDQSDSLGFTLINTLKRQLEADIDIQSHEGTAITLTFEKRDAKGAGSSLSLS